MFYSVTSNRKERVTGHLKERVTGASLLGAAPLGALTLPSEALLQSQAGLAKLSVCVGSGAGAWGGI